MLKVIITVGIPGSGKSTWAKEQIAKDSSNWIRINNDDLRNSFNNYNMSSDTEKLIQSTRDFLIKEALKRNKNVIIDNVNIKSKQFEAACKIASNLNIDVQVFEKPFFVTLDEAIERNSKRIGNACVPQDVIEKFWKLSGGASHKFYQPKTKTFTKNTASQNILPQNSWKSDLPFAVVCDLDGTLQKNHGRSFYDASTCDKDIPNIPVIEFIKMAHKEGKQIIFMSGREDVYKNPTENFFKLHLPEVPYLLYMRKTNDQRKDSVVKLEMFDEFIKDKYNVLAWFDDRNQVVNMIRDQLNITCFQVDYGDF